ncbi:hypothetical protein AB3S75_035116 [Citrus x aurantiifolia]
MMSSLSLHNNSSISKAAASISSSTSTKSLSFDDISKYFSLPLSDAANHLGVCVSVLKKICRDNGLDRWPYRKFLSGKSIEDIKKYAAREKSKELAELSKIARKSGFQPLNNETSKLHGVASPPNLQQQGSKNSPVGQPHVLLNANLTKGIMALDEFKYGFPSDGLSTASYKWWGSRSSHGNDGIHKDESEIDEEDKQAEAKADKESATQATGNEKSSNGETESNVDPQGSGLLTAVRKRTVEEGREALKLGVYKKYCVKQLDRKERVLLHRIFKSSLPKERL